jgi:hypothetical protein
VKNRYHFLSSLEDDVEFVRRKGRRVNVAESIDILLHFTVYLKIENSIERIFFSIYQHCGIPKSAPVTGGNFTHARIALITATSRCVCV